MIEDETGAKEHGDSDDDGDAEGGGGPYLMGAPLSTTDGKSTAGDATNAMESHGITDSWWCATSPEG